MVIWQATIRPPMLHAIPPDFAALLADALLAIHAAIVGFVVVGELLFLAGGPLRWEWVRSLALRTTHLALMLFIALQTWLGQLCPLTIWEQALRQHAGQQAYGGGFIEYWLSRLIFFDAPWWVFVIAYSTFAALVVATWWWVPPRRRSALV